MRGVAALDEVSPVGKKTRHTCGRKSVHVAGKSAKVTGGADGGGKGKQRQRFASTPKMLRNNTTFSL